MEQEAAREMQQNQNEEQNQNTEKNLSQNEEQNTEQNLPQSAEQNAETEQYELRFSKSMAAFLMRENKRMEWEMKEDALTFFVAQQLGIAGADDPNLLERIDRGMELLRREAEFLRRMTVDEL